MKGLIYRLFYPTPIGFVGLLIFIMAPVISRPLIGFLAGDSSSVSDIVQAKNDLSKIRKPLSNISRFCKRLPRTSSEVISSGSGDPEASKDCILALKKFRWNFTRGLDPWGRSYTFQYIRQSKAIIVTSLGKDLDSNHDDLVISFPMPKESQVIQANLCNSGDRRCSFDISW